MIIQLPKDKFFSIILELLTPFKPFDRLTKREREALSLLMYESYKRIDIPFEDRMKIIFNYETRRRVAETMKISIFNLNNIYKTLREKGFIDLYSIKQKFLLTPETHGEFLITFNSE